MQSAAMLIVQEDGGVWLNNDVVLRFKASERGAAAGLWNRSYIRRVAMVLPSWERAKGPVAAPEPA